MIVTFQHGNMKGRDNLEGIVSYRTTTLRWDKNK
jgi:hypothetical protein